MMKLVQFLMIIALQSCALGVVYMKPCDVSWFSESYVVVLNKFGFLWVDGSKYETLAALNADIDQRLRDDMVDMFINNYIYREDSAMMFAMENYEGVLFTGFPDRGNVFRFGAFKWDRFKKVKQYAHYFNYENVQPFQMGCEGTESYWGYHKLSEAKKGEVLTEGFFICDITTMKFNGSFLSFDDNRLIHHSKTNNAVDPSNTWIYRNPQKGTERCREMPKPAVQAVNQIEPGKFKLYAHLDETDGERYYYHVLTRLYDPLLYPLSETLNITEADSCYIRKFATTQSGRIEYPRMLLIPKYNPTDGIQKIPKPIFPITTTTTTSTTTSTTTTTTTSENTDPDPEIPRKRSVINTWASKMRLRAKKNGTIQANVVSPASRISALLIFIVISFL